MANSRKKHDVNVLLDADWYNNLRYNVVPPLFVVVFTGASQWLGLLGGVPCPFNIEECPRLTGNQHSWILVTDFI